jgi:hypothetical protein
MVIRNNNITNIYNLSHLIDLAATVNNNIKNTNKAKSNAFKSDFPNIYNWDFNINIKQNYLGKLKVAFNILKDKYIETEHLIKNNWHFINKFFKYNKKDLTLLINLLGYFCAIYVY